MKRFYLACGLAVAIALLQGCGSGSEGGSSDGAGTTTTGGSATIGARIIRRVSSARAST